MLLVYYRTYKYLYEAATDYANAFSEVHVGKMKKTKDWE